MPPFAVDVGAPTGGAALFVGVGFTTVGVAVGMGVAVGIGVAVGVGIGVAVGVGGIGVAVGVGVGNIGVSVGVGGIGVGVSVATGVTGVPPVTGVVGTGTTGVVAVGVARLASATARATNGLAIKPITEKSNNAKHSAITLTPMLVCPIFASKWRLPPRAVASGPVSLFTFTCFRRAEDAHLLC